MSLGVGQRNRLRQPRPRLVFVAYSAVVTGSETQDGKPSGSNTEPNPNLKQSKLPFVEDTGDLLKEEQKNKKKAELEESEKKSKKDAKLKKNCKIGSEVWINLVGRAEKENGLKLTTIPSDIS
ncbi:hypothetical protein TWF569_006269 [Orbilia oligospora]|uniref:Uncharacterized protein n=1 Tax=Orbilia oligospora TaxID=2813651 RepID=A0A7C8JNF8_ORBOL|nr:hypothetical protein TWF706_004640 [Orbilia oligospora]KAF3113477.1 hypothetical protein TWF102_000136 [Orbilia oligospora]KAF3129081.1 hypothetical protein TWF703_009111 [Orbilia oligospora]KAF3146806.1 hypothetical protein TWF569_006269 [Orbilia oligospora]